MQGNCLCGNVSFEVSAPSLWSAHCHCSLCQRAHGAGVVTWVGCHQDSVKVSDNYLKWYVSSPGAHRGFCQRCGTTLFFKSVNWPNEIHIARANFVTEVDREPAAHGYYQSHVGWLNLVDDLPRK